jgi:retron-type reverse transcriptase
MPELDKPISYIRKRLEPYIDVVDEYVASDAQEGYYKILKRRKRRGGYRFLYFCMDTKIRSAHKVIYELLREYQPKVHPAAHGFVKNRSTLTNAQQHTQQKYLLHLDIKDFFDSISVTQVKDALIRLGTAENVAELISKLATVDGSLRQGLHTSPDLSNHCLYQLDEKLAAYASSNNLKYTRYGDDMTLSGATKPNLAAIRPIIDAFSFRLNEEKIKFQHRGSNQYVTGLTVFDEQPRIPRRFKKRLRLLAYYIDRYGFEDHVKRTRNINREDYESDEEYEYYLNQALYGSSKYIVGHVAYLNSVEASRARPMWDVLNDQRIRDHHS